MPALNVAPPLVLPRISGLTASEPIICPDMERLCSEKMLPVPLMRVRRGLNGSPPLVPSCTMQGLRMQSR